MSHSSEGGVFLSLTWVRRAAVLAAVSVGLVFFSLRGGAQTDPVIVAPGFEFNLFAEPSMVPDFSLPFSGPAALAFDKKGRLFVGTLGGKILILLDNNDDGVLDEVKRFATNVSMPLGLEFGENGDLFVASNLLFGAGRILRLRDTDGDDVADDIITLVDGLPSEGQHQTSRLKFGPDGFLYFSQGSSTDRGVPDEVGRPNERPLNAKILRLNMTDFSVGVFASGLRNPFGIGLHPESGALFATDAGSGEVSTPSDRPAPFDEVNWVVQGGNYGFPNCEGTPVVTNPDCAGVRGPVAQFLPHLTPTSIAFYTGPQAGDSRNQLLVTIFKHLFGQGGDLRRFVVRGNSTTGFLLEEIKPPIANFGIIDPSDGPVDTAIDPISGDIYVARFDPVSHRDPNEHHHFIYRIHRAGSDQQPFIGPVQPGTIRAETPGATISLVGRHLGAGATVLADGVPIPTRSGSSSLELLADLPANLLTSAKTIVIEVRRADQVRSNPQTLTVFEEVKSPVLTSLTVRKKTGKVIPQATVGLNAKKFRLVASGSEFDSGAALLVDGSALELISATSTELVGRFTSEMVAAAGSRTVRIRNSTGRLSNPLTLTIAPAQ